MNIPGDVDVNALTFDLRTALTLACQSKKEPSLIYDIVKILLENGADPNTKIKDQYFNIFNQGS